ncbi:MAG: hypothetical protein M0P57_03485, partial [Syntrophales bacterium]|nr:hypothetical protein [Syntrophales bacterium]
DKDKIPVRQEMVNPETEEIVPKEEILRGYKTDEGDMVILTGEDLDALKAPPSRDIEIIRFLPKALIDHRWYNRSYFLGPDGDSESYFALIVALRDKDLEGLARWSMRNIEYNGALRIERNYPVLITLRHTEEVVSLAGFEAPESRDIDKKESAMAEQLISMLEDDFDPTLYRDEYRDRVMDLVTTKARGGVVEFRKIERKKPAKDLKEALQASIMKAKERKSA